MEKNNERQRGHADARQKRDGAKKHTKSYRHVNLDRQRPKLTHSNEDAYTDKPNEKSSGKNTSFVKDKPNQNKSSQAKHRSQAPSVKRESIPYKQKDTTAPKVDYSAQLKIIPLGGLDAIGKNMTVFECKGDMIIDDAGLMFPDDNHPGVDLILPDYTYVLENAHKLRGIIITHGHEDHTGTLPYLLKDLDIEVPIYGTKLTLGLIECKFAEHHIKNAKLIEIKPKDKIKLGCMSAEFYAVNHSIPGAVGVFLRSPAGNVLHTGDFKLDQTPIDGITTDFAALARFGEEGVDLFMSDSTNATKSEFTPSEASVGVELKKIIANAQGRVIVASFASHIHRLQQICDAAVSCGRKVVVTGRSMIQNTDIARKLGYLNIDDASLIDAYELKGIPADEVVIMCTGSQGEPLSALARIANGEHRTIEIEEGDTVIISATPVPGNEKAVTRIINLLAKIGADVYDKSRARVHVSGHAGAEELKIVLSIVKPRAFMPVHGEATHLRAHARLAEACGIPRGNIFLCENGDSLVLSHKGVRRGEVVQSGIVYVDGLSVGDTSQDVLDERTSLGNQGFASIAAAVSFDKNQVIGEVKVEMHGITGGDDEYLCYETARTVKNSIERACAKNLTEKEVCKYARDTFSSILWERTKQRPMVIVNLIKI